MTDRYYLRESKADVLTLLSAHAQTYEISASDWNRLTWEDVAHAIADIKNEGARWLGRIYILDQKEFCLDLINYLVRDVIVRRRIKNHTLRLDQVCMLALYNFIGVPWCQTCHGAEQIQDEKIIGKFTCPDCDGVRTKRKPTERELANTLGVPVSGWHYIWAPRYDEATDTLERLFDIVNGGIAWRVKSLKNNSLD